MSLNSLQDNMSRRAASMAAMAKRANNPQEIQAIQKSLVAGVQNGSIQPYVGIPLIQELTQKLTEAKAQMAQSMAGAGMQQAPQGQQAPQPPIAQQVMQQAAQESQGLEALPSNLPQEYAGGGIIAFEEGGEVERYQNEGYTGTTPAGRFFSGLGQNFSEANEAAKLRNKLQMQYGPKSALPGLFMKQSDEERQMAKDIAGRLPTMTLPQLQALYAQGPSALPPITPPAVNPADARLAANTQVAPSAAPVALPVTAPAAPAPARVAVPAIPSAGASVAGGIQPTTYTPTAAPAKTDFAGLIKDAPKEAQTAFDTARTKEEDYLRSLTKPGDEAREKKFNEREAAQEKDSAMGRALNLMSLGFGIAGSKERSLAGALGKEGREGIADLIRGEAANRVAKERLEDARDNFEQQKIAAAKGDRSAANAAGQRAAEDKRAYTQLNMQALNYGSTEANQRFQLEQTGDIAKANLFNESERQKMTAVEQKNRNLLAEKELGLRSKELDLNSAFRNEQLKIMKDKYASLDPYQAAQLRAKAEERVDPIALRNQLSKQLGLSKVPAPGADKGFDSKFNILYQNEVASHFNRFLGIGGGGAAGPNPYDGFKLVP